jgi:hypothetical protein
MPVTGHLKKKLIPYCGMMVFLVIAYLPLSSFLFALKNDALTANFPQKYFFSASLHDGFLPLWNPYINFGLPLYADPGFAFWNPITWIFGYIGYTVPMLTVEILFYIWIAGMTAFELCLWLGHSRRVSFCIGMMFMCCGFFIGNLQQINFLTCAAFLPLVIKTYLNLHKSFTIRKLFYCVASLYLMSTGGHPAIPIACCYFLLFVHGGFIFYQERQGNKVRLLKKSLRINLILSICFLLLAAPLFYSYYEIFPRFTRLLPVNQSLYPDTGFNPGSYISFLFPFSATGDGFLFNNDPLMRNGYISLLGLFCLLTSIINKKNDYQRTFLFSGICMLVLSAGGVLKDILYPHLPMLDYIRTNGEFRVFALLSFILAGSYVFADLMLGRNQKLLHNFLLIVAGLCLILMIGVAIFNSNSTLFLHNFSKTTEGCVQELKDKLDALTFGDRLFLNATIIFILIAFYFLFYKKLERKVFLPLFLAIELIVYCWMNLPITGVQMKSPLIIQQYFSEIPVGIPIPKLEAISQNVFKGENYQKTIGCWSYYSKQPGSPYLCDYPTRLFNTVLYFNSRLPDSINSRSFIFTRNSPLQQNLRIESFTPTDIRIRVFADQSDSLVLLQNSYFRWKATVNNRSISIQHTNIAFMTVPLEKGSNIIRFSFNGNFIIILASVCFLLWLIFFIVVAIDSQKVLSASVR